MIGDPLYADNDVRLRFVFSLSLSLSLSLSRCRALSCFDVISPSFPFLAADGSLARIGRMRALSMSRRKR